MYFILFRIATDAYIIYVPAYFRRRQKSVRYLAISY